MIIILANIYAVEDSNIMLLPTVIYLLLSINCNIQIKTILRLR